jgi:uncharacterized protein YlxW (UPF0749 family)
MSEDRIRQLEKHVGDLRVDNASLASSVQHLTNSVDELTASLKVLEASMNKGRGALWVIVAASTFLGGIVSAGINKFFQ